MKNRPLHENLDTSFVNVPALIEYLRRRRFAGRVRIELRGYEADIFLAAENHLKAREYDHIAGRIAEGEEALQRILIRSREPGGIINVYQNISETEVLEKNETKAAASPKPTHIEVKTPLEKPMTAEVKVTGGKTKPEAKTRAPRTILPNLPFEFTNRVEERARQTALSKEDRGMLLNLTGELLGTIDRSLATAKLEFRSAFQKACAEISADYPFLATLDYGKGKIYNADANMNPKFFVAGVFEALRRILDKLATNAKFAEAHRRAVQRILALLHQRRPFYDKFSMTKPLERILGVN